MSDPCTRYRGLSDQNAAVVIGGSQPDQNIVRPLASGHLSRDFPRKAMYRSPDTCPYTGEFGGSFPGLQDLDFANACPGELLFDMCRYW